MAKKRSEKTRKKISDSLAIFRMGRMWVGVVGLILCVIFISISDFASLSLPHREIEAFVVERAHVREVITESLRPDHYLQTVYLGSQLVEIEMRTGEFVGERIIMENTLTRFGSLRLQPGMDVLVSVMPGMEQLEVHYMSVYGPSRGPVLIGAVLLLILGMLIMGRKKGLYAAISLAFTLVVVIYFMISFIIQGYSPVLFALITTILTTGFTLCMVGGISRQSLAAIGGTWVGLITAGLISALIGNFANVSGMHLEDAWQMIHTSPPGMYLRVPDLFFAAVIIAASGAVVDAAMSISSSVFEIKEQSPEITAKRLYRSGMNIGGDILGANSNTLILAFTGASLTTMILVVFFGLPYLRVINLDIVAIEVIQSVSATAGMILAIPATAIFSALLATRYESEGIRP